MRMMSIASGSSGNCIYVGTGNTHILIDSGISNKRIESGLHEAGLSGKDLSGILITHEHSDHIKGLGVLARKYHLPVYGTENTLHAIKAMNYLGPLPEDCFFKVHPDAEFTIGDLTVLPFHIDHDAADPVAYRVTGENKSVAVATDMGHYNEYVVSHLLNLDALLLEANHDVRMLETGPYPYYLKMRILGDYGHLSNENSGRLLSRVLHDGLRHIFLGHLSKENNYEALALETVKLEINESDTPYRAGDFSITVAGRDKMSEILNLD